MVKAISEVWKVISVFMVLALAIPCSADIHANLELDHDWMYQNLLHTIHSNLTANVSITDDPLNNSSYTYEWEFVLPPDVSLAPGTLSGGGVGDPFFTFAAPGCNEPDGLSDSGQAITVRVTVIGDDYGNTAVAEAEFGIALLGDTNNDGVVNVADRSIINAFWRTGAAGPFAIKDCDINCDGVVNVADRAIADAIWRSVIGQNSVSSPCSLRPTYPVGVSDSVITPSNIVYPAAAGETFSFDLAISNAAGVSAGAFQSTVNISGPGTLTFDETSSEAVAVETSYWIYENSVGATALVQGSNLYTYGDGPLSPPSESFANDDIVAGYSFTWDGTGGDYTFSLDLDPTKSLILNGSTYNTDVLQFTPGQYPGDSSSFTVTLGTIYVDDDATNDPCHGNPDFSDPDEDGTAEHPFDDIQEGIDAAFDGDTVIVLEGTYTGVGNRNIDFGGKAITVRSTNPNDPNTIERTIIDCQAYSYRKRRGFNFDSGESYSSVLNGLTITGGYGPYEKFGVIDFSTGGAILCKNSSPRIMNCNITGNAAGRFAGGIYCGSGSPLISNCTITNNSVETGDGGGVFLGHCDGRIYNCVISGNSSNEGGGGIFCSYSNTTISDCIITNNYARRFGAGIYFNGVDGLMKNCLLKNNRAATSRAYGYGGGVFCNNYSNPTINNCTISGNFTYNGGAMHCATDSSPTVVNSILWGNSAPEITKGSFTNITIIYSNVLGGYPGVGNIDADPLFVDTDGTDNTPGTEDDNLRLLPWSPCIDVGDNSVVEPNSTDLDGNPRIINGIVDMGAYEAVVLAMVEVEMKFTPQALNPGSGGNWVKAHLVLPEGFAVEDVDADTPAQIEPLGIESEYMNVFINEDGLVEIEAAFRRGDFCAATDYGPGEVTVIGRLTSGQYFYGTDTIRIITNKLSYVADLASYWLQADCGPPDWCGGLDVDQDSVVDWLDFAMSDGCCIEVIEE